jgi:hypothetical protein
MLMSDCLMTRVPRMKWEDLRLSFATYEKTYKEKREREREANKKSTCIFFLPINRSLFLFSYAYFFSPPPLLLLLVLSIIFRLWRTSKINGLSLLFNWFLKRKYRVCHTIFHLFLMSIYILKIFQPWTCPMIDPSKR